ncbi:hypothetical protein [Actinoplanes sp. ATCC 53533]|uniref:hypothetical protein n=1 Tax=Actinoplanes sp. ATCC 53533 TaxID=1288362 RepID=UPI0013158A41|nr:hypothetical protein [Actinoplanes sp. ATCC 53533]
MSPRKKNAEDGRQLSPEQAAAAAMVAEAKAPGLAAADVSDGAHVNAVGASLPRIRELASDLVRRAEVFVDGRQAALHNAGDLLTAITEGAFAPGDTRAEIGEILLGRLPGHSGTPGEVTHFKSVGLAVQDTLAAVHVWRRASERRLGSVVPPRSMRTDQFAPEA